MRFLKRGSDGELSLTKDFVNDAPCYAILSHTWGADEDEVTFTDLENGTGTSKAGYTKLRFCSKQAEKDGLQHFWVDTCCINKANHTESSEAITSMFQWYRDAQHCYVYLADVSFGHDRNSQPLQTWEPAFRSSRWFTRGWTLQELIAPRSVKFFSQEEEFLGDKKILKQQIQEITGIPLTALSCSPLSKFSVEERLRWATKRNTKRKEDQAYCLLGIFDIFIPLMYGEGDHAFVRLNEEIRKRAGKNNTAMTMVRPWTRSISPDTSASFPHVHWLVTRPANPLFTGRKDLLQDLEGIVRDATKNSSSGLQCRIVLSGMGGQGKSEICLQLAQGLRQIFWGVFWVDVSTTGTAQKSFLDVAQKLSLPAQTWKDACLGIANLKHPWLLVLDNADDPAVDYQDYFPDGMLGVVILTSRNYECQQYATVKSIALEGLSDTEAQNLLLKAARVPQDQFGAYVEDAMKVVSLLQSHPLALIQAGAYISRGHCTLAEYTVVFAQQRQRLLGFRPAQGQSRYRDVYTTFEASADILYSSHAEAAADALQLLPVLATCGPNRLPLPLFEAAWKGARYISSTNPSVVDVIQLMPWHVSHLLPLVQADADRWDSFRLIEAVHLLKAFSLVSTDTHSGFISVSMHPLIHAWARDRQEAPEQYDSWVTTGCLLAVSRTDKDLWRQLGRQLQPHVQAAMGWEMSKIFASEWPMETTGILVEGGWLLFDMRDDAKVFDLTQRLFSHLGLDQQTIDRRWLEVYELAACNLTNYDKVEEAILLLEQLVKIREETLAEAHQHRLMSQLELAGAYRANGNFKAAVSLLEHVVKIRVETLAEGDPSRLISQHELAAAYQADGNIKEAVSLMEHVVKIQERTLTEEHPARLASQHKLASVYKANGQIEKAMSLLENVVKIEEQTLAEEHPARLESQHELAEVYRADGQVQKAVSLLENIVKSKENTLPEDHQDRLMSQHALAMAYQKNGQVEKAVSLLEYVVKIEEQTRAEDHPYRLVSKHNLATVYWHLGRRNAALQIMKYVVEIRQRVLEEHHPSRITSEGWVEYMEEEMRDVKPV